MPKTATTKDQASQAAAKTQGGSAPKAKRKKANPASEAEAQARIQTLQDLDELERLIDANSGQMRYESVYRENQDRIAQLLDGIRDRLKGKGG